VGNTLNRLKPERLGHEVESLLQKVEKYTSPSIDQIQTELIQTGGKINITFSDPQILSRLGTIYTSVEMHCCTNS
jgi:hypothetical protein